MTRVDHIQVAKIIGLSPVTPQCRRRMIITFCHELAGESINFWRDEFIEIASNGRWSNYSSLLAEVPKKVEA